jgi:hypothetical protein
MRDRDGAGKAREGEGEVELQLDRAELDLLRSALRYLESTLGREEADELKQVQDLEARLDRAAREGRG